MSTSHTEPSQLSVIVFAFNEAENIPTVLAELRAWLLAHVPGAEVVFVDDGSHDGTGDAAARALAGFPHPERLRAPFALRVEIPLPTSWTGSQLVVCTR